LNRPTSARRPAPPSPLWGAIDQLKSQRNRIAALADTTEQRRTRGKCLLVESYSLAEKLERSRASLANTLLATKATVANLEMRSWGRENGSPTQPTNVSERVLRDSPDMVEALQQSAEILKMEFQDTEGSGRDTLVKCEKVLRRIRSVRTIELPLY
jgi:hypothetical protein